MTAPIILIAGFKNSGKTTLIEILTADLFKRGFRIAIFKHVFYGDFTVDYEGKDTWRFIQAGAKGVVAVSKGRLFINEYLENYPDIDKLLKEFRERYDIIFLEGFKELLSSREDIYKVIIGKDLKDISGLKLKLKGVILSELQVKDPSSIRNSKEYKILFHRILKLVNRQV